MLIMILLLSLVWLRANKISLNTSKTEIARSKIKTITEKLNFQISGQNIPISKSVKYLGVMLNENLSWDSHMAYILPKLNRGLGLLSKIRYYVPKFLLNYLYLFAYLTQILYMQDKFGHNRIKNNTSKTANTSE